MYTGVSLTVCQHEFALLASVILAIGIPPFRVLTGIILKHPVLVLFIVGTTCSKSVTVTNLLTNDNNLLQSCYT
mgnify:FL=1